jgi:hypothetical protein
MFQFFRKSVQRISPDDFMLRLPSSVVGEGMLHEGNIYLMDLAIRQLPASGCVLEIGSYGGLSANLMLHLMRKQGKDNTFFSCDAWIYEGYHDSESSKSAYMDGRTNVTRIDYMTHIKSSFVQSTRLLNADRLPHSIHARSDDFFKKWEQGAVVEDVFERHVKLGGPVAFAYIDGDHSYEAAKRDFENTDKYLIPKGMILLDDSSRKSIFGSARLVHEIKASRRYAVIGENPNFLLQKL